MIYFRCIVTGLITMAITAVVVPISVCYYMSWRLQRSLPDKGVVIGFDPVSTAKTPLAWAILACAFALGFYWRYRGLKSSMAKRS